MTPPERARPAGGGAAGGGEAAGGGAAGGGEASCDDAAGGGKVEVVSTGVGVPGSPLVSICIPVLADPTLVLGCLGSLARARRRDETETVVVANGMPVSERQALEGRDDIVLIRSGTNLGFAGGNNLAAEIARGRYLFFVNDDSTVAPDCIDQLLVTLDLDQAIGAVGCRILSADGSLQEAGSVLWNDGSTEHVGFGLPAATHRYSYVRDVAYLSANGLMVTRRAWDAVGGFDERFFPAYYEDVDLCMALRAHGFRVVYEPRARLHHLESQSTTNRYRRFLLAHNRRRFVAKWRPTLAAFGDPPEEVDASAIERSVHRARGAPQQVLVVPEGGPAGAGALLWEVVDTLATDGWAVTVASPTGGVPGFRPDRSARADRLADLGVELGAGTDEVLDTGGTDWDVIVTTAARWRRPPVTRSDGTEVPVVTVPDDAGGAGVRSAQSAQSVPVQSVQSVRSAIDAALSTPDPRIDPHDVRR